MNSYVAKQSYKHTISFCIFVSFMLSFTIEQLDAQVENPLPLKHTKRIEFTTNEVTWMSLDVSPDGSTIVFEMLGDLYTLPVSGGKASQITHGSAFDSQPRYSPDGSKILFVSDRSGSENLWTLETGKTVPDNSAVSGTNGLQAITYGKNESFASPEWTPDGNYVIVSKASDAIWIDQLHFLWIYHVDGGSGAQLKADDQAIRALGAAFGSDNRYMYSSVSRPVQNGYPNQIEVYDIENGTISRLTNLWGGAIRPTISPNGTWMVYASKNDSQTGYRLRNLVSGVDEWFLYPVQLDAQGAGEWISTSEDLMPGFSFTPDGTAIITSFDGKLYRVAVPSGMVTEIPFEADVDLTITPVIRFDKRVPDGPVKARQIRYPSISPDGTKLLFTALHKLYIQDLKSGDISRLGEMEVGQYTPSWSHSGNRVAFTTWSDNEGGHVYKIDVRGRNLTKLSKFAGYFSNPVWTPNDEELIVTQGEKKVMYGLNVFSGRNSRELELVRIPARGGESVSNGPLHGVHPYFADIMDRYYVFERSGDLTSYQLDGTDKKVHFTIGGSESSLTSGSSGASDVLIGPDGEQALVQSSPHIYKITLPASTGGVMDLSLTDPTFPVEKLTTIGGQFMSWGPRGNEAVWSLGNTVFRYNFTEAHNKSYEPIQTQLDLEYPRRQGKGTLVLRGARILTMESHAENNGIIENGAIVISGNRIATVAPSNSVNTPDRAREIDVRGKTIVPGYVDLHMHTRVARGIHNDVVWEYLANLAYGVTTTRDPQTGSTDAFTYSDLVETGEIVGPRVYSTGPGLFRTEKIKNYTDALNVLKRYAEYYKVNTIKQYLTGDRTVRQLVSMASQETEIIPTSEGHDNKLMMSQVFDGYSLEHNFPYVPLYKDMIEVIAQSGTYYTPTMIIARPGPQAENYYWTQTEVHDDKKLRKFTPHGILDSITRRKRWYHNDEYVYQIHAASLTKIIEAGGKVCVGSHAETWGIGFHWDLWTIQSGGMSEMDALKTATIFGAEAIGFDEDLGSIREGKIADMVILNSNPLDDIRNTADVYYVMKNGLLYNGDSLDMLWPDEEKLPEPYWNLTDPQ